MHWLRPPRLRCAASGPSATAPSRRSLTLAAADRPRRRTPAPSPRPSPPPRRSTKRAFNASSATTPRNCAPPRPARRTARRARGRGRADGAPRARARDRLERAHADTLQQLAAAERERAQLAKAAARKKPATSTKSPLRPRTARSPAATSPAARSPATPTKAFQALVAGGAENRDARRALVAKGRDEYHALRRANGDLRSQRDGLVDEVASLKKELAQTRLVLHGMECALPRGTSAITMALCGTLVSRRRRWVVLVPAPGDSPVVSARRSSRCRDASLTVPSAGGPALREAGANGEHTCLTKLAAEYL